MVKENFTMTEDMMFGQAQMLAIMAYIVMFIVGLTTNTMSLTSLLRERLRRKDRSKMTLLLIHLSVADLTVYCQALVQVRVLAPVPSRIKVPQKKKKRRIWTKG